MSNIKKATSVDELRARFPDEAAFAKYLAYKRWGGQPRCYFCGSTRCSVWRADRIGYYRCKDCRKLFSIKHGSIFEGSKIPLLKWLWAWYHLIVNRKGVPSMVLSTYLGLCQPTTFYMMHRSRRIMGKHKDGYVTKGGMVEVDELYSGGNPKNMHAKKRYGREPKAIVFGIKERDGYTLTRRVKNNKKETLQPEIKRRVKAGSPLSSDGHKSYGGLKAEGYIHKSVDHSIGQYVKGKFHTNGIESVWAVQERAYYGVYHHFTKKYRNLYQNEFDFRLNLGSRQMSTMDAIDKLIADCWIYTGCYNGKRSMVLRLAEYFGKIKADLRRRMPSVNDIEDFLRKLQGLPPLESPKRCRLQIPRCSELDLN